MAADASSGLPEGIFSLLDTYASIADAIVMLPALTACQRLV